MDLAPFVKRFLGPGDILEKVMYYTAPVSGLTDPGAPVRQQVYFRALHTLSVVEVCYGNFLRKNICRPLVDEFALVRPLSPDGQFVMVKTTEEKGSDVNLASHLLRDAFTARFDAAIVVSADTDLVEPIRIVAREIMKPVGLIHPDLKRPVSKTLREAASFVRHVSMVDLVAAQFPERIQSVRGSTIAKPPSWV